MSKNVITERIDSQSFYSILDGNTPEQVIEAVQEIRDYYGSRDIYFDIMPSGYDGMYLYLYERRFETDEECTKRTDAEKKQREKKKDKEYAEYLRLQAKFGETK